MARRGGKGHGEHSRRDYTSHPVLRLGLHLRRGDDLHGVRHRGPRPRHGGRGGAALLPLHSDDKRRRGGLREDLG